VRRDSRKGMTSPLRPTPVSEGPAAGDGSPVIEPGSAVPARDGRAGGAPMTRGRCLCRLHRGMQPRQRFHGPEAVGSPVRRPTPTASPRGASDRCRLRLGGPEVFVPVREPTRGLEPLTPCLSARAFWRLRILVLVMLLSTNPACLIATGRRRLGSSRAQSVGQSDGLGSRATTRVCAVTSSLFGWEVSGCDAGTEVRPTGLRIGLLVVVRAGACGSRARAGPCRHQRSRG
jgi:hypothetical protein